MLDRSAWKKGWLVGFTDGSNAPEKTGARVFASALGTVSVFQAEVFGGGSSAITRR